MQVVAVIPARFGSTRFPGKALANQTGKYLIQHVYEQVTAARSVSRSIVATDDQRILDAVRSFGGQAAMTGADHESGTDRVAELVRGLDGKPDDIILNIQGDEPEIEPAYLDRLVERLAGDSTCPCATLACPFPPDADPGDPNSVKVVCDRRQTALYFSRALIPYRPEGERSAGDSEWLLHLGVYAFRRAFLLEFASWEASTLERIERLEQLRVLDNGFTMAVAIVPHACVGIDTPEDYERFVARRNVRRVDSKAPST
jgi:3-deoxy-manno-octulosonate cytidylyltransferase (CMP-KDO synthetase)